MMASAMIDARLGRRWFPAPLPVLPRPPWSTAPSIFEYYGGP